MANTKTTLLERELHAARLQISLLEGALEGKFNRHVLTAVMDGSYAKTPRGRPREAEVKEVGGTGGIIVSSCSTDTFELMVRGRSLECESGGVNTTVRVNKLDLFEALLETLKIGK